MACFDSFVGIWKFCSQQLQAKEKICQQEMRTAVWNSSRKKAPEEQRQPTLKDMPSRLTITSFFQRKNENPVINDGNDILEDIVAADSEVSSDVGDASECKIIMTASNVERFLTQLGKNQASHSTLLFH
jgi:hypothetical protein